MTYEFDTSKHDVRTINSLMTGTLFVEEGSTTVYMATDEKDDRASHRRCVNLRNGLICYFDWEAEVQIVTLIDPPVFGYA